MVTQNLQSLILFYIPVFSCRQESPGAYEEQIHTKHILVSPEVHYHKFLAMAYVDVV